METQSLLLERNKLLVQFRSGATWFYWIAALSVVNMIISLFNGSFSFVIGLGATQMVQLFLKELSNSYHAAAVIVTVNVIISAVFALFGFFALKRLGWVFITGAALYALDGLLFLLAKDFLSIAFHGLAIFFIIRGFIAVKKLRTLEAEIEADSEKEKTNDDLTVTAPEENKQE